MKQTKAKQERTGSDSTVYKVESVFPPVIMTAAILLAAVAIRILWLGEASFRADTLHFYQWVQQGYSFSDVFGNWSKLMNDTAQFPLPAAIAVGLVDLLHLPPTPFAIRLADVLFGGLAVLFGAMACRELGGRSLMLFGAALWILNPFHLQLSREAYFYSALVTGASMLVWAVLYYSRRDPASAPMPKSFYWVCGFGFLFSAYSHFTGWIIATVCGLALIIMSYRNSRIAGVGKKEFNRLLIIPVAVAFPLLFYSWAIPYFLKDIGNPAAKAESIRVMGEVTEPMWSVLWRYALTMGWGSWTAGMVVTVLAIVGFLLYAVKSRGRVILTAVTLLVICLAAYMLVMKSRGIYVAVRHVSFLFPIYYSLLAVGLWEIWAVLGQKMTGRKKLLQGLRGATVAVSLALFVYPDWHVLRLTGYPTPYQEIKTWFDTSLPPGTPVLVDRWFEPWNELTIYPTTNVVFMFTGPNEPLDVFLQSNWREQAKTFLTRNPDAAYFEIAKSYQDKPEVGPWPWPHEYFARHTSISNSAGLVLRELGLAYREDFYPANSNRVVVDIFYNTREDVLAKLRNDNIPFHAFFGPGLRYEKSGPMQIFRFQTQVFADWRVLEESGELEVVNLTDAPASVVVRISAVSPRGPKLVTAGNGQKTNFTGGRLQGWELGPMEIPPGSSKITLHDSMWVRAMNPLLISEVQVVPVESPSPTANAPAQ